MALQTDRQLSRDGRISRRSIRQRPGCSGGGRQDVAVFFEKPLCLANEREDEGGARINRPPATTTDWIFLKVPNTRLKVANADMFFAASLLLLVGLVVGDDNPDEIKSLPGVQFDVNFRHYSGYLQVAPTRFYHYWFVESQNNPTSDPVIFWFNGGPGCSSIDGLLNEMGPYIINRDGKTLRANEYAWNKFASVVYIESPAGVGFSYATDGNLTTADWQTAEDNYEALKQFFAKYPSFRENKVFTAGESYGGVYVPTLTSLIVEGQSDFPINLRGMLIGNGYVNTDENLNTVLRFAYAHGIVGEKAWRTLENECCRGCDDTCDFANVKTPHCQHLVEDIYNFLWAGGLNPYDLYRNCDPSPTVNSVRHTVNFAGIGAGASKRGMHYGNATDFMSYIQQQQSRKILSSDQDLADVPCLNDTDLTVYLNDPEVRKAIHVDNDYVKRWYICSGTIDYHKVVTDTAPQFKEIVAARVRVLLYYGDTDMACNFLLGQEFSANLGLPQTLPKTPWKVDGQIAGFKTLYKGLTYTTIRGAGHMAPQWRAPQTTHVIQAFINNHPI